MQVKVNLKPSADWTARLAEQFGVEEQSPTGFCYAEGKSFFRVSAVMLDKEVAALLGEIHWHQPFSTLKIPLETNDYWTLMFVDSEQMPTHFLTDHRNSEPTQAYKSMLLYSSKMTVDTHWPVGKRSRFLAISFHRDWLFEKLDIDRKDVNEHSPLAGLLISETGTFIQGVSLFEHTVSVSKLFDDSHPITRGLAMQAECYKLIADFIDQLGKNNLKEVAPNINKVDFQQIVDIEYKYFGTDQLLPNIDFLAREAGMSLSKFKKCFKEIYLLPPYEYHLNKKLETAKQQLIEHKRSISEIAFQLGYTSAANFDKAFKKKFLMSPTKMMKINKRS